MGEKKKAYTLTTRYENPRFLKTFPVDPDQVQSLGVHKMTNEWIVNYLQEHYIPIPGRNKNTHRSIITEKSN